MRYMQDELIVLITFLCFSSSTNFFGLRMLPRSNRMSIPSFPSRRLIILPNLLYLHLCRSLTQNPSNSDIPQKNRKNIYYRPLPTRPLNLRHIQQTLLILLINKEHAPIIIHDEFPRRAYTLVILVSNGNVF